MQIGEPISIPDPPDASETESGKEEDKKYSITIGAHLDSPSDLIGHAFVSVEYPAGKVVTKGFWPKNGFDLAAKDDRKGVVFGMDGAIYDDTDYLYKTAGLNAKRKYSINRQQAEAALDVIHSYETNTPQYRLLTNQCAVFAIRVLRATGNSITAGVPARPSVLYETLSGKSP